MKLSLTGDGYVKCSVDEKEKIISERITQINTMNLSLPCMKDRYDDKVLFYHIGDNISISEYLQNNVLDFEKTKKLVLNISEVFIEIQKDKMIADTIVSDINYVFISPHTEQIKVIQYPVEEEVSQKYFKEIMRSICQVVKSHDAYIAIGYIMESIADTDFKLEGFVSSLSNLANISNKKSDNNVIMRPKIEKQIVEKVIYKSRIPFGFLVGAAFVFEAIAAILLPLLFEYCNFKDYYNIVSYSVAIVLTIITLIIWKIVDGNEYIEKIETNNPSIKYPIRNMTQKTLMDERISNSINSAVVEENRATPPEQRSAAPKMQSEIDKTGILEQEVEINPVKRQEMYSRNSVPKAALVSEETQKKIKITQNDFIIGRTPECNLTIDSGVVSKKHAEIIYKDKDFFVRDLGSSNFTYLNKAQIEPEELYKIENGARIGFGNKWYIFEIGD